MSEAVLVAIIGGLSLVLVAMLTVLTPLLISTHRVAKQTNYQVTNDHTANLRVEQDERHVDNQSRLGQLEIGMVGVVKSVHRIETHLGIEATTPNPRRKKQ